MSLTVKAGAKAASVRACRRACSLSLCDSVVVVVRVDAVSFAVVVVVERSSRIVVVVEVVVAVDCILCYQMF